MRLDTWDQTAAIRYDQQLWNELASLRFLDGPHGAVILGSVGVGKTHLASALGHIAIRMFCASKRHQHLKPHRSAESIWRIYAVEARPLCSRYVQTACLPG
jgi:hypothetical protein